MQVCSANSVMYSSDRLRDLTTILIHLHWINRRDRLDADHTWYPRVFVMMHFLHWPTRQVRMHW
ncbi:hypothetical protein B0I35DRAFT_439389 [Stachybotrys elegans]|uniref:Uncharacterized protein n=1 Tax=Stachybotrys elegans TaxID=80388 RepID=A0A8K0SPL5_9HYPO|nr:hypothetical protein B0I35DRAFT_439389 [Stachybotrys elegans]